MKKFLSIILVTVMLLTAAPIADFAGFAPKADAADAASLQVCIDAIKDDGISDESLNAGSQPWITALSDGMTVVLESDWTINAYNSIAVDVYLDDVEAITSFDLEMYFDSSVFSVDDYDYEWGKDTQKVEVMGQVDCWSDSVAIAGFFRDVIDRDSGLPVNLDHFHIVTIYFTVKNPQNFERISTEITIEGEVDDEYYDYEVSGKIKKTSKNCLDHTWETESTTAATCTKEGVTTLVCSICGASKTESIAALGHKQGAFVTTHNGMQVYECTRDATHYYSVKGNASLGDVDGDGTIASTDARSALRFAVSLDTPTAQQFTAADVNKNGTIASDDARTILRVAVGLDKLEDDSGSGDVEIVEYCAKETGKSCTQSGERKIICQKCGTTVKTIQLTATGHNYRSTVTRQATCTATGIETHTCTVCGDSYTSTIAKQGHNYKTTVTQQATCTATGIKTSTCTVCGDSYTSTIAKTGHSYSYYACDNCGLIQSGKYYEFMKNIIKVNGTQSSNGVWVLPLNSYRDGYELYAMMNSDGKISLIMLKPNTSNELQFIMYLPFEDSSQTIEGGFFDVVTSTGANRTECYFICEPEDVVYNNVQFSDGIYSGDSSVKESFLSMAKLMVEITLIGLQKNLQDNGYVSDFAGFGFPYYEVPN